MTINTQKYEPYFHSSSMTVTVEQKWNITKLIETWKRVLYCISTVS